MKKFLVITLFPEIIQSSLNTSMMWKASKDKVASFEVMDLRQFGLGPRRQVDDKPFGGGAGMLLMIEPLTAAIKEAKKQLPNAKVLIMTPAKTIWNQQLAKDYADSNDDYIIICGHYEGFDARVFNLVDQKISIGKYVLTGGELPALIVIDSIVRLLPNVLGGGEEAIKNESYSESAELEYPQYTRPEVFAGQAVPGVLLSGNHAEIASWREQHQINK